MTAMSTTSPTDRRPLSLVRVARWGLAALGVACVGLGALGVFVPGLPTTIFLIIAVWCFAKSCPYLEGLLVRNRLFAPFLRFVDRAEPIPARTKATAITVMWIFVVVAGVAFLLRDGAPAWLCAPVGIAACIGTVAIVRWDEPSSTRSARTDHVDEVDPNS